MSSIDGGHDAGGENEDGEADEARRTGEARAGAGVAEGGEEEEEGVEEPEANDGGLGGEKPEADDGELEEVQPETDDGELIGDEALAQSDGLIEDVRSTHEGEPQLQDEDYPHLSNNDAHLTEEEAASDLDIDAGPATPPMHSPSGSPDTGSIPDDTPSLQGSLLSSPSRVASPLGRRTTSRTVSAALQPFERRFESRLSASPTPTSRAASPAFLTPHSRQLSLTSPLSQSSAGVNEDHESPERPWDVIRWTKLRKITAHAFSDAGKRNFGRPTCLAVSALIAIGTSKGLVLGFDYHQTLKIIIGPGTKAPECGSVTALAIAADYSTIASGHANGCIFTWEIAKPAQPFLRIPPVGGGGGVGGKHVDGHVAGVAILHVGFLGTRHTALVSADAGGMAFSHLASRGLGAVTRTVKSTRLLGRYPQPFPASGERNAEEAKRGSKKPSSVLAFAPLPLGNVEQATDGMGLTALLTPYLLVIVSTTPIAQTQHKAPRPKEVQPHGTLSGCLAWFPAVRLKSSTRADDKGTSGTKLVYCWSNILTVLDVIVNANDDPNKPPSLAFRARRRWRADEAIVAIQWLGRSVLGVLTISQRLLIVEDGSLQVTDAVDLLGRHLYHQDLFSQHLRPVVERAVASDDDDDDDDAGAAQRLHGVVADAFYMSLRAYKGRTFLLGFDDLTVGTLSNWADRLVALMEAGDYLAAIRLGGEYYARGANNVTVGLPEEDGARHEVVRERVLGMVGAALRYTLAQQQQQGEAGGVEVLTELAGVCFEACVGMQQTEYLFTSAFELFEEAEEEGVFVTTLEPYVLAGEVSTLPPQVVRSLVAHFIAENQGPRLEELLCRLDPLAFDLDQITLLCRQHCLYEALIHVWTLGIGDFVAPVVELLGLVLILRQGNNDGVEDEDDDDDDSVAAARDLAGTPFFDAAMKVFPYLAYALTGRRYPSGLAMEEPEAARVKADLYEYLFAGAPTAWPRGSQRVFRTRGLGGVEPAFPYLVLLLEFDAGAFVGVLNEGFEDSFLNEGDDEGGRASSSGAVQLNGTTGKRGFKMTRQHILSILLSVMRPPQQQEQQEHPHSAFAAQQVVYLDMFIARSLPKYPGQLALSGSLLNSVLARLCSPPSHALKADCELSVEYLLSAHRPPDTGALLHALREAGFWRVARSVYRGERMFVELLDAYFEGPRQDREGVFEAVAFCLRPGTGAAPKQLRAVERAVLAHGGEMAAVSVPLLVQTLAAYARGLLAPCVELVAGGYGKFVFLRCLLEPGLVRETRGGGGPGTGMAALVGEAEQRGFLERYVQLMCVHDPTHVAEYVDGLPSSNLRLAEVLPAMEAAGVVDAAVVVLAREGLAKEAMERLGKHLRSLQLALVSMVDAAAESPDAEATGEAMAELVGDVEKYSKVGVWLCQGQSVGVERRPRARTTLAWEVREEDLDLDEFLWLQLVDAVVLVTKNVTLAIRQLEEERRESGGGRGVELETVTSALRGNVQRAFTSLLTATAATTAKRLQPKDPRHPRPKSQDNLTFLRILRAFLTRAAATAPSLADLRVVLADIFSAYTFEQGVLSLANDLLGSDVFAEIQHAHELRQRGWRPRGPVCELCKRRAWGQGVSEAVWGEWVAREQARDAERARKTVERSGGEEARRLSRGKDKDEVAVPAGQAGVQSEEVRMLALVVFACKHVFHRGCLDGAFRDGKASEGVVYKCPLCMKG
ncbi:hypothetical protein LTR08_001154 [Meristemomyces frigidus]|nr:hypothetical protein LTR08_001154 [Meristemomyces frigidus]